MDEFRKTPEHGVGYLQFRISTAQGAIPLEQVQVIIRTAPERGGHIVSTSTSDRSGLTQAIPLETLPRALSETPGVQQPFYRYSVEVSKQGYYTQYYRNVPVFDGISAVQSVEMIPLPQNGYEGGLSPDAEIFYEGENPNL